MLPKDLLEHLEKGDRTMEMLDVKDRSAEGTYSSFIGQLDRSDPLNQMMQRGLSQVDSFRYMQASSGNIMHLPSFFGRR